MKVKGGVVNTLVGSKSLFAVIGIVKRRKIAIYIIIGIFVICVWRFIVIIVIIGVGINRFTSVGIYSCGSSRCRIFKIGSRTNYSRLVGGNKIEKEALGRWEE